MADSNSRPGGLEALLQTLDPRRREILLFLLKDDHQARLGAELVGPRALNPDKLHRPGIAGWTSSSGVGDITMKDGPIRQIHLRMEKNVREAALRSLEQAQFREMEKNRDKENEKKLSQLQKLYRTGKIDTDEWLARMDRVYDESSGKSLEKIEKNREKNMEAVDRLLYRDGILQPFVVYRDSARNYEDALRFESGNTPDRNEEAARLMADATRNVTEEMKVLVHELGHVGDEWLTRSADMDAEFGGRDNIYEDWVDYDHPDSLTRATQYRTVRKPDLEVDEPYSRLMDRYNRGRLAGAGYPVHLTQLGRTEKKAYVPDRYWAKTPERVIRTAEGIGSDPFATSNRAILNLRNAPYSNKDAEINPGDAAAHPAQAAALMELNRRAGRDPLEGMDAWMKKHGH